MTKHNYGSCCRNRNILFDYRFQSIRNRNFKSLFRFQLKRNRKLDFNGIYRDFIKKVFIMVILNNMLNFENYFSHFSYVRLRFQNFVHYIWFLLIQTGNRPCKLNKNRYRHIFLQISGNGPQSGKPNFFYFRGQGSS